MPHSTVSSEPLTSPTPSPPPSAPPKPSSIASARATGLESGSELSELSDDDRDPGANDEDDDHDSKTRSTRESKTRGRRKRGGVVPGDMWDWAYKTKKVAVQADDDRRDSILDEQQNHDETQEETHLRPHSSEVELHGEGDSKEEAHQLERHQHAASVAGGDEEKDQGKGEDDMEIDSSEDNRANDVGDNPDDIPEDNPDIPDDNPEDNVEDNADAPVSSPRSSMGDLPAREDGDVDAESDGDVDEQDPEPDGDESVEDDEDDIASSRPSSPGTEIDIDVDAPLIPPVAKIGPSSSLSAPMTVPVPVMHPSPDPDPEDDAPPDPDAEVQEEEPAEQDGSRSENDEQANDKADVDADAASPTPEPSSRSPTPEQDLLDLQPAHRAEALDALALIELKFAQLREQLYIEKMDELVEEESMVFAGTHPELLHLQLELSVRRDKRVELATRRLALEQASIRSRKRDDQNGVWQWWKYERDGLQADMIAQHNRKRRKLERQRRSHERPQPQRRVPPPPQPRLLPPAQSLASILDFDTRTPYTYAFHGQRPTRPGLTRLTTAEIETDLGYITGGKRRFWSVDGPNSSENVVYANGAGGDVGAYAGRDAKERDRERVPRPGSIFEQPQSQQFRAALSTFGLPDEPQGPGQNGWPKRRIEEDARSERERERDRERERSGQRQSVLPLHSHSHPHSHPHQHQQHPPHTHHGYSHSHQHIHSHTPLLHSHPHPHHHHVHVHHHHHPTTASPGGGPGSGPPPIYAGEKPTFPHIGPGGPSSEKGGGFWRGGDEAEGTTNVRDRERDKERDRDRDRRGGPPSALGFERVMSSSFGPPSSPRHQHQRDSWEEAQAHASNSRPQSQPTPPGRSPAHQVTQSSSGRVPLPHALSHHPHPRQNSLGSPPTRRQAPESPLQAPHAGHSSGSNSNANAGHTYPSSPRSLPINPVPAAAAPPPPKTSSSRPLSPVQAKMVSGAASTSVTYSSNSGSPVSRRSGESFAPAQGPGSRAELFASGSAEHIRSANADLSHEMRGSVLTGLSGGSTAESAYSRDRRDRVF